MDMEIITSAASTALANIVLAVIALAGADRKSTRLNSSHRG